MESCCWPGQFLPEQLGFLPTLHLNIASYVMSTVSVSNMVPVGFKYPCVLFQMAAGSQAKCVATDEVIPRLLPFSLFKNQLFSGKGTAVY